MPGERLSFKVEIDNKSDYEIIEMSVKIKQKIYFHATDESQKRVRKVAQLDYPISIPKKRLVVWSDDILIPPVCASTNGTCRIIQVFYGVLLNFNPATLSLSKKLEN